HELRNPLASLRGLAELLGRDFDAADPRSRYVATMLTAIDRLDHMIEDLLLFSSPAPALTEHIDLASLVRELALFIGHGTPDRNVRLEVAPAAAGISVVANRDRVVHAFTNILRNAVQATPDGGVVTARVDRTDREAIVCIHNTGSFIPPDVRAQLFVPFFTTKSGGTGLGLAIARQFITAAGGRIDVDSDQADGTTFSVALPLGATTGTAAPAENTITFSTHPSRA
ncbi:MAG TPA: ATP-binding protein, partial [Candidatus Limnocylindria bacterium]|nr:ATP-binding protein [Candidatus Limnocylindria bacterium]